MNHDFEILGQKFNYPRTWHGALCIVVIMAGIFGIAWLAKDTPPEKIQQWYAIAWGHDSKGTPKADTKPIVRQLQFWTPSEETARYVKDDDDKWEVVTPEKVENFDQRIAKLIDDRRIDGYRRYRVFGHGRHRFKAGWWWVMTVYNDFKTGDFVKEYSSFWNTDKTVYIEEITSDPHYLGDKEK